MRKKKTIEQEYLECDGCKYLMGSKEPLITVTVPFDYPLEFLREDRTIEFHFHALTHRHDCFRYWAHNPRIMRDSLTNRGFDEEQIDEFLSLMLYREDAFHPGVARPEVANA
jgi:hypothetical protein